MDSASLSNKKTIYALLALVGAVVIYLLPFKMALSSVSSAARLSADNKATMTLLKQNLANLKAMQQEFASKKAQVEALAVALPPEKQMAEVVAMLEAMATKAGVSLENIQPQASTAEGVPVSTTVSGSFQGILTFTELAENNIRPFKVGLFNITAGDASLTVTIDLVAMYQVPAEDLPETAATEEVLQ